MPRVLTLRALCERCKKAEAVQWNRRHHTPLCPACIAIDDPTNNSTTTSNKSTCTRGGNNRICPNSVITALCAMCVTTPATVLSVDRHQVLCTRCARKVGGEQTALRDSLAVERLAFDRMDFSNMGTGGTSASDADVAMRTTTDRAVDLSYFKTKVPKSVLNSVPNAKKRSSATSESEGHSSSRRRR